MQEIATSGGRTFWLLQQPEPLRPSVAFDGRCFACLLWDSGSERTVEQRHLVVAALIEAGCRYFVCGGDAPSAWEQAADEAFVMMTLRASEPEVAERLVMTTAHETESEAKVVLFFVSCTNFSTHSFTDFLVLTIGSDSGAVGRLCSAVREVAGASA
jgi:hypothetical protein